MGGIKDVIKNFGAKLSVNIIAFVYRFIKKKEGRICIIDETPNSGSNAKAIYEYIITNTTHKDVFITKKFIGRGMSLKEMYMVASSHIYICTHTPFKISNKQVCILTWHGIPLKRMNYMDKEEDTSDAEAWHKKFSTCDYILSSSNLYEVLMSSCIGIPQKKFVRTGFPRNDILLAPNDIYRKMILELFGKEITNDNTKIIVYLPTFRIGHKKGVIEGKLRDGNLFGFEKFDLEKIDTALKNNNCVLLAKLHPLEEKLIPVDKLCTGERVKIAESQWFEKINKDLYSFLSISDMLITDYSSVYFDYLLLDRPIIFINNDLEEYKQKRGLLLEPYDFWTPGYKVKTDDELVNAINAYMKNNRLFAEERKRIRDMVYEVNPANNCERVWKEIIAPILGY